MSFLSSAKRHSWMVLTASVVFVTGCAEMGPKKTQVGPRCYRYHGQLEWQCDNQRAAKAEVEHPTLTSSASKPAEPVNLPVEANEESANMFVEPAAKAAKSNAFNMPGEQGVIETLPVEPVLERQKPKQVAEIEAPLTHEAHAENALRYEIIRTPKQVEQVPFAKIIAPSKPDLKPAKKVAALPAADKSASKIQPEKAKYTLQLLAVSKKVSAEKYIERQGIQDTAQVFEIKSADKVLFVVGLGPYASREKANEAKQSLPHRLAVHKPWVRQL